MVRLFCVLTVAALLSSCAPAHYGYAPNLRPSLAQLAAGPDDAANPFRASAQSASAGEPQ
jgi:hypothetical protein